MKRVLLIITVTLSLPVVAWAASLGLTGSDLGAGTVAVVACDNAFTYTFSTLGGNVTSVTVGGIADPACEGGSLSLSLTNSAGDQIGSGGPQTVATDGDELDDSAVVTIAAQPDGEIVAGVRVVIEGP